MAVVDKVLVGEALVVTEGGDNEISHIDLLMGPRGSAAVSYTHLRAHETNSNLV